MEILVNEHRLSSYEKLHIYIVSMLPRVVQVSLDGFPVLFARLYKERKYIFSNGYSLSSTIDAGSIAGVVEAGSLPQRSDSTLNLDSYPGEQELAQCLIRYKQVSINGVVHTSLDTIEPNLFPCLSLNSSKRKE